METVLEGLGEPTSLSPLSTAVHDEEDFPSLGGPPGGPIVETHMNSDVEEALDPTCGVEHDVANTSSIVTSAIPGDDDDDPIGLGVATQSESLSHVEGLGTVVAGDGAEPGVVLGEVVAEQGLDESEGKPVIGQANILGADGHLVHAAEQEGILLTTDADGNLAMPVSTDQVIRFLMQTSDGNVVTADAQVEAIKFTMAGLIAGEAGEGAHTVQAVALPDGTTTFIQTPKEETAIDSQSLAKLTEGQTIKLEDGTTALLQPASRGILNESLQAIQLEDGTTAFIAPSQDGFDPSALNMEQFTNQSMLSVSEKQGEKALVIGDKAYKCMYADCGRLYTTLHHLKVHERSHTGDRPFTCEYPGCGKAFATGYGLKSHNRVHTGEKPYPCQEVGCEKAFKTSGDLQKHVRTHTGERPFRCPFEGCTRSFTTSNIRKVHIRTHTGERPYICDVEECGRAFASATNYKNHIRIHTGEKPYVCSFLGCGKSFTEYSSLYKHHVVHTHTKPYTCCYCGKTYRQTSTLAMHKRSAHGEDMPAESASENAPSASDSSDQPAAKKLKTEAIIQEGDNLTQTTTETNPQVVLLAPQVNPPSTTNGSEGEQQLTNLVTLQSQTGTISLQDLQQSGLQGLPANFPVGENSQVLVVTPSQLEMLQQLAAQQIDTLSQAQESSTPPTGNQNGTDSIAEAILPQ